MVCIYCGHTTQVVNSRPQKRQNAIWRRRQCKSCQAVFTSIEQIDLATSLTVRRTMRHLEPFNKNKLLLSIHECCKHRDNALADAEGLVATIVTKCIARAESGALTPQAIAAESLLVLQRFDPVAATMYGAFHKA